MTMPLTTVLCKTLPPRSFAIRTLSTFSLGWALPGRNVEMQARVIRSPRKSSYPACLVPTTARMAAFTSSTARTSCTLRTTKVGKISTVLFRAIWYPVTISEVCTPFLMSSSAFFRSSPANDSTKFVLSPYSISWVSLAKTSILAAGCWTSSSLTIVAQSLVTIIFSKWFTTNLFIPFGPRDVCTIPAIALAASMLRSTAPCTPSKCLWPSFNIPPSPAAAFKFIDFAIVNKQYYSTELTGK
mmetsp:Transcript_14655/g.22115  ORF Transcript_14655/g.22115 Transcript_14655/m.22115 type:complete len:242 (-) Transcript_14655:21-746(-)